MKIRKYSENKKERGRRRNKKYVVNKYIIKHLVYNTWISCIKYRK